MNKLRRGKQSQIIKKTLCKKESKENKEKCVRSRITDERNWQLRRKELKLFDLVFLFPTCPF